MKVIVVAGGEAAAEDAAHLVGADLVIAADSGAVWLSRLGVRPDLVLGDLDSIPPPLLDELAASGVEIERHSIDKDASDLELGVRRAVGVGADEVVLIGALGGDRLDHEVANLLLVGAGEWRGVALRLVRSGTSMRAIHGGDRLELDGAAGDLVTLLPVGGDAHGVLTHGLRYPLSGDSLALGGSRGLSNAVAKPPASVELEQGSLLVIESRRELDA